MAVDHLCISAWPRLSHQSHQLEAVSVEHWHRLTMTGDADCPIAPVQTAPAGRGPAAPADAHGRFSLAAVAADAAALPAAASPARAPIVLAAAAVAPAPCSLL